MTFETSALVRAQGRMLIIVEAVMANKLPPATVDQLTAIRDAMRTIIPGGRDPEASYHAKDEALRGLNRLIGR